MKLRQGFVSNSSSTQFVASKNLLTEEQMKQLRELIRISKNTCVLEGVRFFAGEIDDYYIETFLAWRDSNTVPDDAVELI